MENSRIGTRFLKNSRDWKKKNPAMRPGINFEVVGHQGIEP